MALASHPFTAAGFSPSNASPEAGIGRQLHNGRRKRPAFAVVPYARWVDPTRRAEAAANVSTGYVSQIECGARQPSQKALTAFAAALNLDIEDLSSAPSS